MYLGFAVITEAAAALEPSTQPTGPFLRWKQSVLLAQDSVLPLTFHSEVPHLQMPIWSNAMRVKIAKPCAQERTTVWRRCIFIKDEEEAGLEETNSWEPRGEELSGEPSWKFRVSRRGERG